MKAVLVFLCLVVLTTAAPQGNLNVPQANPFQSNAASAGGASSPTAPGVPSAESPDKKITTIIKDERTNGDDGSYSVDVETSDGILLSESGSPGNTPEGAFIQQGSFSFTHPGGEKFDLKYVANENGFQPESANLPVAPAFPHPIPQFVMDQIVFAAEEDKLAAEKARSAPTSDVRAAGGLVPSIAASSVVAAASPAAPPPPANPAPPPTSFGFP